MTSGIQDLIQHRLIIRTNRHEVALKQLQKQMAAIQEAIQQNALAARSTISPYEITQAISNMQDEA